MTPTTKEIKYSGYAARPSDYDSPDGQLALSLNLLNEDGVSLQPLCQPKTVRTFPPGVTPVFLHKAVGAANLVTAELLEQSNETVLRFCDYEDSDSAAVVIDSFVGGILSCTAIGNTLIVAATGGLRYYLFKDGSYIPLGDRPPFVSISMGVYKMGTLSDTDTCEYSDCPAWTVETLSNSSFDGRHGFRRPKTAEDEAAVRVFSTSVMGLLLSNVADKVTANGLFYQPFFVRYAFRLFDGSYAWHSAPVLMLPSICPPRVDMTAMSYNAGKFSVTSKLNVPYFALSRKVLSDGLDSLEAWEDIITSIDVFVSAPIYTYSQSEQIEGRTNVASLYLRSRYIPPRSSSDASSASTSAGNQRRPLQGIDSSPEYAFIGHYADSLAGSAEDHNEKLSDYASIASWDIAPSEKLEDAIADCAQFYLYASIPLKDVAADDAPVPLEPDIKDLSNLQTRPILPDDWQSHFRLMPSYLSAYNSRLHLCGMRLRLPEPLPVASLLPASGSAALQSSVSVRVWSRRNGVRCSVLSAAHGSADMFPLASELPRWLWYPDPSAYMMELQSSSKTLRVPLAPHPTLNGAYWFAGLDADPAIENVEADPSALPDSAPALSKVYVSEATNPFTFPAAGIVTVGSGEVFALSSAAKALSQGQFGQFPLYAFTSEGVWALEVSSSGSYSARQPITRDVALSPNGICQIDSAVLFCSDRGVMLLSGSQSQCISESIDTDHPFLFHDLPGLAGVDNENFSIPLIDSFHLFLKKAAMVFDYPRQRIILFSRFHSYAYVYSLRSKLWGMMRISLSASVPSYPETLALDSSGSLVDASRDSIPADGLSLPAILVSRPLKLGLPDVLKTVIEAHQRGNFKKGHVKTLLYGSRDLNAWHLISSSVTHRLLNRRGSPYRYFIFALLCSLDPDESLSGATVRLIPRFPGRLG